MAEPAPVLEPAARCYRGAITRPERWSTWVPARGDILVCTPPKCGTTWTQTMLAMLVHGGADLPAKLPVLSPWVDADLGVAAPEVAAALAAQTGRRVVKTHTPADGFPVWDGVTVIAVYRHPLDVFLSVRKHMENRTNPGPESPMLAPLPCALRAYLDTPFDSDSLDGDSLSTLAAHYSATALSGRVPGLKLFHYADMIRDGRRTVRALADAAGIAADDAVIERVASATAFGAMRDRAADYTPVAGTGFWKSDTDFFATGGVRNWEGLLTEDDLALYRDRLAALVPGKEARRWLEQGSGAA